MSLFPWNAVTPRDWIYKANHSTNHYLRGRLIGKGGYGEVYEVQRQSDGKVYAMKVLAQPVMNFNQRQREDTRLCLINEAYTLNQGCHPYIVALKDVSGLEEDPCIIMEKADESLSEMTRKTGLPMEEHIAQLMARQILQALSFLHASKVTHRDIKAGNILVFNGANGLPTFKLADFGLAKQRPSQTEFTTYCGTPIMMAPEITSDGGPYNELVDVYSFGLVLYEVISRGPMPNLSRDASADENNQTRLNWRPDPTFLARMSQSCSDLIVGMLHQSPSIRPSADRCLQHPWVMGNTMENRMRAASSMASTNLAPSFSTGNQSTSYDSFQSYTSGSFVDSSTYSLTPFPVPQQTATESPFHTFNIGANMTPPPSQGVYTSAGWTTNSSPFGSLAFTPPEGPALRATSAPPQRFSRRLQERARATGATGRHGQSRLAQCMTPDESTGN